MQSCEVQNYELEDRVDKVHNTEHDLFALYELDEWTSAHYGNHQHRRIVGHLHELICRD